jgi:hypothetical protein
LASENAGNSFVGSRKLKVQVNHGTMESSNAIKNEKPASSAPHTNRNKNWQWR